MLIIKDGKVGPAHLKIASSPSYTLAEIEQLTREFVAEQEGDTDMLQWTFSIWLAWLAKREREVGDGANSI